MGVSTTEMTTLIIAPVDIIKPFRRKDPDVPSHFSMLGFKAKHFS